VSDSFESLEAETDRIIRTGTVWTAAAVIAPALILGPMLAAGWRPDHLPGFAETFWWIGAIGAAIGVALLLIMFVPWLTQALPHARGLG